MRVDYAAALGALLAILTTGSTGVSATDGSPFQYAIAVSGDRGVLQVTMETTVSRPAERYEFLIGTPAESDRTTLALMSLVAGVWPTATLDLVRGTTVQPFASSMFDARTRPRIVRASLPGPLTDAALRAKIDQLLSAVNARPIGDSLRLSRIVGLADGYASCAPFKAAATRLAAAISRDDARSLGEPVAAAAISDVTIAPVYLDLSTPANALCSVTDHLARSTERPSFPSGGFTDQRFMRVVRRVHFALPRRVSPQAPPSAIGLLLGDAPLAARFDAPVLTLDGDAYARTILAGDNPLERGAENVRSTSSGCSDDPLLFPVAVADAAGRAERLAALLRTTVDPRPVAVAAGPPRSCVSGEVVDRRVAVAFRLKLPHSTGTPSPETSPDDRDVGLLTTKMMLPRIVAAAPSLSSEARRELVTAVDSGELRTPAERSDCRADADLLARDTIWAALGGVPASRAKDVVAIELHGPYVVEGSCRGGDAGRDSYGLGPDPRVRLAAYARVAYR